MNDKKIIIGEKEYRREELLEFGKQHYPKFYWIYRGSGLGLISIGLMTALIYTLVAIAFKDKFDERFVWINYSIAISFGLMAIAGIVLFIVSFKKKPDEAYIKHAIDYYTKLDANLKARDARIKAREERIAKKEENKNINELLKYKKLLDAGVITQEDYDKKKEELLNSSNN